jgi:hypothetical protein
VLADDSGPEPWQRDIQQKLGQGLLAPDEAVRVAVASGHGIGKSALVALGGVASCSPGNPSICHLGVPETDMAAQRFAVRRATGRDPERT